MTPLRRQVRKTHKRGAQTTGDVSQQSVGQIAASVSRRQVAALRRIREKLDKNAKEMARISAMIGSSASSAPMPVNAGTPASTNEGKRGTELELPASSGASSYPTENTAAPFWLVPQLPDPQLRDQPRPDHEHEFPAPSGASNQTENTAAPSWLDPQLLDPLLRDYDHDHDHDYDHDHDQTHNHSGHTQASESNGSSSKGKGKQVDPFDDLLVWKADLPGYTSAQFQANCTSAKALLPAQHPPGTPLPAPLQGQLKLPTFQSPSAAVKQIPGDKRTPRDKRVIHREFHKPSTSTTFLNRLSDSDHHDAIMSAQGKWREEQVLIICPGSQTTLAQLGCAELTLPALRVPTRMFKDEDTGDYHPNYTFKRKKASNTDAANAVVEILKGNEDDYEWVEDRDSVEGAIYPIVGGRIANMDAFLAFLEYVHSQLTTTYHNTPIVLMASPQWTKSDVETISRYTFEKTKTPALCLLHSAVAAQYGLKWPTVTIVDIGFEKVDVTCLYDSEIVSGKTLGFPNPRREISGGEVFTQKLLSLLKDKNFSHGMAEQLKKSLLCEVLPYAGGLDELMELPTETGAPSQPFTQDASKPVDLLKPATQIGAEDDNGILDDKIAEEGVLDVANIVTSGNTREFLAKKEKEKATRGKKGKGQELEPAKAARLPNSKRQIAIFHYEELSHEDVSVPVEDGAVNPATETPANGEKVSADDVLANGEASKAPAVGDMATELPFATEAASSVMERRTKRVRKDIEIGLERFLFADRSEIDRIAETIYRTVQGIDEIYKRSGCWDNIIFVGNGSRLRGLKENIMQTLHARHLISPSSATIFTSELPSNMATPTGTGAQTPTGSIPGQMPLPTSSSVNPLLQAATTAQMGIPGSVQAPGSMAGEISSSHHSHAQTPTSIKMAPLPNYLAEWAKHGFEESMFLGSLIAARLAFCIHNLDPATQDSQRFMSLNRVDYNEYGPKAVRDHSMLG